MARAKKRADGRYCSQIYLGRDENGKRKYKSVYAKTPAELKEKETSVRLQLGQGLDVLSQRDSFATWADDWLRLKEKEQITCRQMDNYRRAVKLWKEELPGYEIGQVRADDVERVLIALSDQGLAQRTVDLYRSAMRQIMRRAVGRVIPTNPVEQVELAAVGRKAEQRRALTAEEQQWIWNTPHRAQPVAVIMMLSGLRRGELAALTWNDVDLKARTITVNKTIEYDSNGTPTLRHVTKSDAGMRTVDIPQRLADYMAAMPRDGLLVIHSAKGEVMTATAWAKLWRSYMRELNIKYATRTPADLERMRSSKPPPKVFDMTIRPSRCTGFGTPSARCSIWPVWMWCRHVLRWAMLTCPRHYGSTHTSMPFTRGSLWISWTPICRATQKRKMSKRASQMQVKYCGMHW